MTAANHDIAQMTVNNAYSKYYNGFNKVLVRVYNAGDKNANPSTYPPTITGYVYTDKTIHDCKL